MPLAMRGSKALTAKVLCKRMVGVQTPLKDWCHKYVSGAGVVDWSAGGAYQLKWSEEGLATSITYMGDGTEATVEIPINNDMVLMVPWDISAARLVKRPANYRLIDFFESDKGPYRVLVNKNGVGLDRLCTEAQRDIDIAERMKPTESMSSCAEVTIGEKSKQVRTEKVKAARERAQETAKRRRTISVT